MQQSQTPPHHPFLPSSFTHTEGKIKGWDNVTLYQTISKICLMLFTCCLPTTMGEGCSYRFRDANVNKTYKHTISLQSVKIKAVLKRQGCHSWIQTSADFLFQFQFSVSFAVNHTTSKRKGQRGVYFWSLFYFKSLQTPQVEKQNT